MSSDENRKNKKSKIHRSRGESRHYVSKNSDHSYNSDPDVNTTNSAVLAKSETEKSSKDVQNSIIIETIFDLVVKLAMTKFKDFEITESNITDFTSKLMELVKDFPIRGVEKKQIVLDVLAKFTDKKAEKLSDSVAREYSGIEQLQYLIANVLPFTIDTLYDISKNKMFLQTYEKTKKWCGLTFGCCNKEQKNPDVTTLNLHEYVAKNL